ncbi:MAG TPA: hypothetical protein VHT27_02200 [Solirubrobacteraceae bacterium]|jgi:hypothetical protein|nr:hypothetical protein [Solirubrobacteraceae bacterium]
MKLHAKIAVAVCALVLGAVPALAVASHGNSGSAPGHNKTTTTSTAGTPPHGHAYGVLCAGQSKKKVPGQKGTPFSQCVTAMAKIKSGATSSPRTACAALSKKHEKGAKGTAFSRCVSAAAKLLASKDVEHPSSTSTTSATTT